VFEKADLEKKEIARRHPGAVIVFDAALLIETEAHLRMDWTLLAYVDRATQIDRLIRRSGLSLTAAERRIDAQMPLDDKIPFADEIIDNRKPLAAVKEEVGRIYQRLTREG
jgi:dephospho-CoA kinase